MKRICIILFGTLLTLAGCASKIPKHPAITFDHQDKVTRTSFNNLSAEELQERVGLPLIKGYDTLEGEDERLIYRLVYVQADQGPVMIEDVEAMMKKNKDTGVKCMSFNFSKFNNYKFKSAIAPLSWDNDCNYYRDIKEEK